VATILIISSVVKRLPSGEGPDFIQGGRPPGPPLAPALSTSTGRVRLPGVQTSVDHPRSASTSPQSGTVCYQHDSSLSLNTSQRWLKTQLFGQSWTQPGVVEAFLYEFGAGYKCHHLLTYLMLTFTWLLVLIIANGSQYSNSIT